MMEKQGKEEGLGQWRECIEQVRGGSERQGDTSEWDSS